MLKRNAFSMIEVLVGICIFSLAILPLIWLSSNQTKGAHSAGKHMMAGQLAASFMDNLLKRPYEELLELKGTFNNKRNYLSVIDEPPVDSLFNLPKMIESINNSGDEELKSAEDNIKTSFRYFKYMIYLDCDTANKIILITVDVQYRVVEGDSNSTQSVSLSALKFGERDG